MISIRRQANVGFTLIELLVVIAIIGVLAALVTASINDSRSKSRDTARLSQAREFQTALELYHIDNNFYPCAHAGSCNSANDRNFTHTDVWSSSAGAELMNNGYIRTIPEDPIFGTNSNRNGCIAGDGIDTGYCYCHDRDRDANSYILTLNMEGIGARCAIHVGDTTGLCTSHQSGLVDCNSL